MSRNNPQPVRRLVLALAAGGMSLVLAACGGDAASTGSDGGGASWKPYEATAGDTIPKTTVKFGMRPYADNTFYEIGIKKGWFEDVGITVDPITTTEDQWTNLLLQGSTEINSSTCAFVATTYVSSDKLKCLQHGVTFFGQVMFARADLGLKSVEEYMAEGDDFKTALKKALEPLTKGDDVSIQPGTGELAFTHEPFAYAGLDEPNFKPQSDNDAFTQAQAGKIKFLHPSGAPIAVELIKLGWKPIYTTETLVEGTKDDPDSPFRGLVVNNGIAATADYASEHQDTVLRFGSVMYRIAAETKKDPTLFDLQAPYLNSVAGTNLSGQELADLFADMHPLETFEEAGPDYFDDPESAQYYKTVGDAVIADQVKAGTLQESQGLDADSFIWADDVYRDLVSYKKGYEELVAKGGGDPELMAKAKQQYDIFNFLDAYRFALAATK